MIIKYFCFAIAVFFLSFTYAQDMTANLEINKIKKTWVRVKETSNFSWNTRIVPYFLDFERGDSVVIVRGLGNESENAVRYSIKSDSIMFGDRLFATIRHISDFGLVLRIKDTDYSYFALKPRNEVVDTKKILETLTTKGKWGMKNCLMEFTLKPSDAGIEKAFTAIQYKGSIRVFGTYFVDSYKGHAFFAMLIDGQPKENFYLITCYGEDSIELREVDLEEPAFELKFVKP